MTMTAVAPWSANAAWSSPAFVMPPPPGSQPTPQSQPSQAVVLDGVLERVTFRNPETGYTIARIAPDGGTGRGPVSASTEPVTALTQRLQATP